jgi:hypothetical protein
LKAWEFFRHFYCFPKLFASWERTLQKVDKAKFAESAFSEVQLLLDIEVPKIRTLRDTPSPLST